MDELDDDEYGDDDKYKNRSECEYGTESELEVVDFGFQDQYEDGTWEEEVEREEQMMGMYEWRGLVRGPCVLGGDACERVRLVSPDETMGGVR